LISHQEIKEGAINLNESIQNEIEQKLKTAMEHSYFQLNRLAMGAPLSAILAEAYIQNMDHKEICPVLVKLQIIGYFRYVDDIVLIYDQR
jgi:hypothetical protein